MKPRNLLRAPDGTVKIADFGIARADDSTQITLAGTVLGTAAYLAPEQARGEPSRPAADLYALGVVFYELLTGSIRMTPAPSPSWCPGKRRQGDAAESSGARRDRIVRLDRPRAPLARPAGATVV